MGSSLRAYKMKETLLAPRNWLHSVWTKSAKTNSGLSNREQPFA